MAVTTGMDPTVQIQSDKTKVRLHPLQDGIHDESLDLEAVKIGGATAPTIGIVALNSSSQPGIDDLGAATKSCTTP
jgi:hypothetical protein